MKKSMFRIGMSLCVVALLATSCKDDDTTEETTATLYSKLGGTEMVSDPANAGQMIEAGTLGLRSVVDSTILVIAGDSELNPYFETLLGELGEGNTTGLGALSQSLTAFFVFATGKEGASYSGLDMATAHDPSKNTRMGASEGDKMKVNNADFDAFVGAVVVGAQQNNVPLELIQEVGALLETTRADVVQR
mgnify:FL=1|tara:strand:+ start:17323 stop:17895 length:573 start_codon:yes stop_codon:yes gene_type:complete